MNSEFMDDDDKSRRNLVVFSGTLSLIYFLDLSFVSETGELNILGLKLSGFNPQNELKIWLLLLGCQIYIGMRYWVSDDLRIEKFNVYRNVQNWAVDVGLAVSKVVWPRITSLFWKFFLNLNIWVKIAPLRQSGWESKANPLHRFINLYWAPDKGGMYWNPNTLAGILVLAIPHGVRAFITPWGKWTTNISIPVSLGAIGFGICISKVVLGLMQSTRIGVLLNESLLSYGYVVKPELIIMYCFLLLVLIGYWRIVFYPITEGRNF